MHACQVCDDDDDDNDDDNDDDCDDLVMFIIIMVPMPFLSSPPFLLHLQNGRKRIARLALRYGANINHQVIRHKWFVTCCASAPPYPPATCHFYRASCVI
jgi:hypothetical protein